MRKWRVSVFKKQSRFLNLLFDIFGKDEKDIIAIIRLSLYSWKKSLLYYISDSWVRVGQWDAILTWPYSHFKLCKKTHLCCSNQSKINLFNLKERCFLSVTNTNNKTFDIQICFSYLKDLSGVVSGHDVLTIFKEVNSNRRNLRRIQSSQSN